MVEVEKFEKCEFWLPPEFFSNEDFEFKKDGLGSQTDSFCGTNSDMSSPVLSSNESESDEDEFVAELTHKVAKSTIEDKNECRLSSSPKSPLCKGGGEFCRRKMVQESENLLPRNEKFVPMEKPMVKFGPPQFSYQQLLAFRHLQFQEVRRQQMMNQTQQNRGVKNGERMPMGLPVSPWPQMQRSQPKPQIGGGMRAVFLGNNVGDATKPRAGTGVFLPRVASSNETRKTKPACPPVLIPDRVVQALNLNLETLNVHNQVHHRPGSNSNSRFSANHGAQLNHNSKIKKNHVMQSIAREEPENQEVFRLPSEWTY